MIKRTFQRFASGGLILLIATILGVPVVSAQQLRGTVSLDGSSTVFPISEAVAEEFLAVQPRVRVTVGVSGTGGGFKKFIAGEIDYNQMNWTVPFYSGTRRYIPGQSGGETMRVVINLPD